MPRFNHQQNSFSSGEISPKLYGRNDLNAYASGLEKCENFIVTVPGGATFRPGTVFVKTCHEDGSIPSRLIPFVFSQEESYIVEITDIAFNAVPALSGIRILKPDGTTCAMAGGGFTVTGAKSIYKTADWVTSDLFSLQYTQIADALYITHPHIQPIRIVRTDVDTFRVHDYYQFSFAPAALATSDQPFMFPLRAVNITTTQLSSSGTTGPVTITASVATFVAGHEGSVWRKGAGYFVITTFTNATTVSAEVLTGFPIATAVETDWQEAAWSDYRGYPRAICYYDNRLIYGGTVSDPDTIWLSKLNNICILSGGSGAQAPTDFTISSSTQVNEIQYMNVSKSLIVGTLGATYVVSGYDPSVAIGPTNFPVFKPDLLMGSEYVQAKRADTGLIFVQRNGTKVQEMAFDFNEEQFKSQEMTLLSEHMVRKKYDEAGSILSNGPKFTAMEYQPSTQILWLIDSNGGLTGLTRDKTNNIQGMHWHTLGGVSELSAFPGLVDTKPQVRSICVIPSVTHNSDDLYMVVERLIDGATVYYIEYMNTEFLFDDIGSSSLNTAFQPIYSDSAKVRYEAVATDTFTGYTHLIGEEVVLVGDGKYLGTAVVSAAGEITTPIDVNTLIAGLGYTGTLKTLKMDGITPSGYASQATPKKLDRTLIRFFKTVGAKFGYDESNLETILFRPQGLPMSSPIPLFSGDKVLDMRGSTWDRDGQVFVVQYLPFPCTVTSIISRGVAND